jgi:hypothetical protein
MATVVAQSRKLSVFFGRIAQNSMTLGWHRLTEKWKTQIDLGHNAVLTAPILPRFSDVSIGSCLRGQLMTHAGECAPYAHRRA